MKASDFALNVVVSESDLDESLPITVEESKDENKMDSITVSVNTNDLCNLSEIDDTPKEFCKE